MHMLLYREKRDPSRGFTKRDRAKRSLGRSKIQFYYVPNRVKKLKSEFPVNFYEFFCHDAEGFRAHELVFCMHQDEPRLVEFAIGVLRQQFRVDVMAFREGFIALSDLFCRSLEVNVSIISLVNIAQSPCQNSRLSGFKNTSLLYFNISLISASRFIRYGHFHHMHLHHRVQIIFSESFF